MILTSTNNLSETPSLEYVKALFEDWRGTRPGRRKIPEYLWEEVKGLSKRYTYSQISSGLGISYQQLLSHLDKNPPEGEKSDNSSPPSPFVTASFPLEETAPESLQQHPLPSFPATLEIRGKDGAILKATGFHHQDLVSFIHSFLNR